MEVIANIWKKLKPPKTQGVVPSEITPVADVALTQEQKQVIIRGQKLIGEGKIPLVFGAYSSGKTTAAEALATRVESNSVRRIFIDLQVLDGLSVQDIKERVSRESKGASMCVLNELSDDPKAWAVMETVNQSNQTAEPLKIIGVWETTQEEMTPQLAEQILTNLKKAAQEKGEVDKLTFLERCSPLAIAGSIRDFQRNAARYRARETEWVNSQFGVYES